MHEHAHDGATHSPHHHSQQPHIRSIFVMLSSVEPAVKIAHISHCFTEREQVQTCQIRQWPGVRGMCACPARTASRPRMRARPAPAAAHWGICGKHLHPWWAGAARAAQAPRRARAAAAPAPAPAAAAAGLPAHHIMHRLGSSDSCAPMTQSYRRSVCCTTCLACSQYVMSGLCVSQ